MDSMEAEIRQRARRPVDPGNRIPSRSEIPPDMQAEFYLPGRDEIYEPNFTPYEPDPPDFDAGLIGDRETVGLPSSASVRDGDQFPEHQQVLQTEATLERIKVRGKSHIVVDVGSNVNVIGENTLADHQSRIPERYAVEISPRQTPMRINGVGRGAAHCDELATIPIAVRWKNKPAQKCTFLTNIAKGIGKDLPAIMGNRSMQDNDAILIMREGEQTMIFPGKGGYSINCSPGTRFLPMERSATGHLVISSDHFEELMAQEGNPDAMEVTTTFVLDHTNSAASSSSSSGTGGDPGNRIPPNSQ